MNAIVRAPKFERKETWDGVNGKFVVAIGGSYNHYKCLQLNVLNLFAWLKYPTRQSFII
jgi:hypothetical protein